jgi:hypothetical protein
MGTSSYSRDAADKLYGTVRASMNAKDVFKAKAIDVKLDPKNVKANPNDPNGVKMRVARDSKEHPNSNAVAVFFDVTGSMGGVPKKFAMNDKVGLGGLMRHLTTHNYIPDPQVFFGAIGDRRAGDHSPLQVGEFESGMEMDEHLTSIHLEGGGGGGHRESYELALYFAARHMAMDCLEKRGKKGYLFLVGDESPYDFVSKADVQAVLGSDEKLQGDIPIADIIKECQEKFEVFFIFCDIQSYSPDVVEEIKATWKKLLGERMLTLKPKDDNGVDGVPELPVCELIGLTIGTNESGDLDVAYRDLIKTGSDVHAADAAKTALIPYMSAGGGALKKGSVSGGLPKPATAGKSERL